MQCCGAKGALHTKAHGAPSYGVQPPPPALMRRTQWLAAQNSCSHLPRFAFGGTALFARHGGRSTSTSGAPVIAGSLRTLHPATKAHQSGKLRVSPLHTLAFEVHGNPSGQPVLCVHGGPGAGAYANHARFFDARHWRIILVDQRGCGASTPRGCLEDNTTDGLVEDCEKLRQHLHVDSWVLFGGSWGTALSLAYAQRHTDRVGGLILRAMCLMRPQEIDWMYRGGAAGVGALQPAAWAAFLAPLSPAERTDPLAAWHARLTSSDPAVRDAAAGAWLSFDMAAGKLPSKELQSWNGVAWNQTRIGGGPPYSLPPRQRPRQSDSTAQPLAGAGAANGSGSAVQNTGNGSSAPAQSNGSGSPQQQRSQAAPNDGGNASATSAAAPNAAAEADQGMSTFVAQAMLTAHYSINRAFLLEHPILENIDRVRGIPAIGVQGRMDLVCPPGTAFDLHTAWPELRLRLVGGAGHSQYDSAVQHELLQATDALRDPGWARRPAAAAAAPQPVAR